MNERLFKRAIEVSFALRDKKTTNERVFVACCVFHKGRLIHIGTNSARSHPLNLKNPLHCRRTGQLIKSKGFCAESSSFIGIRNKTNINFDKLELVNIRIDKEDKIGLSRPCNSCSNLLQVFSPKSLYFSVKGDKFGAVFERY